MSGINDNTDTAHIAWLAIWNRELDRLSEDDHEEKSHEDSNSGVIYTYIAPHEDPNAEIVGTRRVGLAQGLVDFTRYVPFSACNLPGFILCRLIFFCCDQSCPPSPSANCFSARRLVTIPDHSPLRLLRDLPKSGLYTRKTSDLSFSNRKLDTGLHVYIPASRCPPKDIFWLSDMSDTGI